jgi:hypothetical protein
MTFRPRTLVIGSVVLTGAALVLFCCGGSQQEASSPVQGPAPVQSASADAIVGSPPEGSVASPGPSNTASPATATAPAPSASSPSPGAGSRIAGAVATSDPRDLKLLAGIERDLQRDPPPEIHALIAARKRGAGRDELARMIQGVSDVRMRVFASRWLDEVAPAGDAGVR